MKTLNFIACEDIRTEQGGKHTLIGVHGASIAFQIPQNQEIKYPFPVRLCFFFEIEMSANETLPENFSVTFLQNDVILPQMQEIKGVYPTTGKKSTENTTFQLALKVQAFPVTQAGEFICKIEFKANEKIIDTIIQPFKIKLEKV